ncbi:SPOR domain-containing protein [Chitinibacteraceae bacterium HSL-7]
MRDNVSEELLQLRKRARRRLVGAIALVLFALTVLWTVMDEVPPPDVLAASQVVELEASAPSAAKAPTPTPPRKVEDALAALPGKLVNDQISREATEPPGTVVEPVVAPTPQPVATPVPAPVATPVAPKPTPKPDVKPTPKLAVDPARILNGEDGSLSYVQVGAYGSKEKADSVIKNLKVSGLSAKGEAITVKGVELVRVRIGPMGQAEAEKAAAKARTLGYAPQIVGR